MRKKLAGIIVILCILAVAVLLFVKVRTGAEGKNAIKNKPVKLEEEIDQNRLMAYVEYANTFLELDQNGVVAGNISSKPQGLPRITGIEFTDLIYGEEAETENTSALSYALKVAIGLDKNRIIADEIHFE